MEVCSDLHADSYQRKDLIFYYEKNINMGRFKQVQWQVQLTTWDNEHQLIGQGHTTHNIIQASFFGEVVNKTNWQETYLDNREFFLDKCFGPNCVSLSDVVPWK